MATIDKRLCSGAFSDSNATLYTAPAGASALAILKAVTLCNTHTATVYITLKLNGVIVINEHGILSNDTLTIPFMDQILQAEELLEGFATVTSVVNYYISGKEVT